MNTHIWFWKLLVITAIVAMFTSCSKKQPNASWTDLGNNNKAWLVDSASNLFAQKKYIWTGSYIENMPHGEGTLKCMTNDNEIIYSQNINAYFGCLNTNTLDKINNGGAQEVYWGDSNGNGKQGLVVIKRNNFIYIGEFDDDKATGDVTVYDNEKLYYKGGWDGDVFKGEGTLYYPNGNVQYCGALKNSKRNGKGIEYYENGNIHYEGSWKNDQWNGFGTYMDSNGVNTSHVWEDGKVKARYDYYYSFLESHKSEISEKEYGSTKKRILFFERFEIWLITAVVLLFLGILAILITITHKERKLIKSGYYKDKHTAGKAYLCELFGGIFGFHYAYLASFSFIIHWLTSLVLVVSVFQFIMLPTSFWTESIPLLTKIPVICLAIFLLFDIIIIPYRVYVLKSNYYRHDIYESDILAGRTTDLEQTCKDIQDGIPKLSAELEKLIDQANSIGNRQFVPDDSGFALFNKIKKWTSNDGSVEFETQRLDDISEIQYKIAEIFEVLEIYNNQLSEYLEIGRISAMKNLICAKDLMGTIKKIGKSQEQALISDTHSHVESKIIQPDSSLYVPVRLDLDAISRNCSTAIANLRSAGIKSDKAAIAATGIYVAAEIINNAYKKKRKKQAIQSAIVDIVMSIRESSKDFAKSKSELLRYEEILTSLFVANRAFVLAYCELRDTIYTKTNFFNFLFHRINRKAIKNDREKITEKLATLQQICSDYNRINKTTVKE